MTIQHLKDVARVRGELDRGAAPSIVLRGHGMTEAAWRAVEEAVMNDLADALDRGEIEQLHAYRAAYNDALGDPPALAPNLTALEVVPGSGVERETAETAEVDVALLQSAWPFAGGQPARAPLGDECGTAEVDPNAIAVELPFRAAQAAIFAAPPAELLASRPDAELTDTEEIDPGALASGTGGEPGR